MNHKRLISMISLVCSLTGITAVNASTFVALTAEELIEQSSAIIQGRVIGLESRWDEQGRIIVTDATIQVTETIVGDTPPQVVVRTPGGTVADYRVEADGFPQLAKGEEVVLFVSSGSNTQVRRIVGHQQGHVEVVRRLDGVSLAVPRMEEGISYLTPSGKPLPPMRSTELGTFKARLRAEAARINKPVN